METLSEVVVITNARFHQQFLDWSAALRTDLATRVLDDGSTAVEERLGALGDLALGLSRVPPGTEGFVVVAGDNLVAFDLRPAARAFTAGDRSLLLLRRVSRAEATRPYNEVVLDEDGLVVQFREKPLDPTSGVSAIAFYFFTPEVAALLEEYLATSGEHDAPGHFISWLVERTQVGGFFFEGPWYDTGSLEGLEAAREALAE